MSLPTMTAIPYHSYHTMYLMHKILYIGFVLIQQKYLRVHILLPECKAVILEQFPSKT